MNVKLAEGLLHDQISFFEEQHWQTFFKASAEKEQSEVLREWWNMFALLARIPTIMVDVDSMAERAPETQEEYYARKDRNLSRSLTIRQELRTWHEEYQRIPPYANSFHHNPPPTDETQIQSKIRQMYMWGAIFVNRVATLFLPESQERTAIEDETQKLAIIGVLSMESPSARYPAAQYQWRQMRLHHEGIRLTKDLWKLGIHEREWRKERDAVRSRWKHYASTSWLFLRESGSTLV